MPRVASHVAFLPGPPHGLVIGADGGVPGGYAVARPACDGSSVGSRRESGPQGLFGRSQTTSRKGATAVPPPAGGGC